MKVTESVCDKMSMPANGGTTARFMRPRALVPPTIQLGNSGIDSEPRRVDVKPMIIDLDLPMGQQGASREIVQPERLNSLAA